MPKSLGTLTIDLVAKIGGFVAGMDEAERKSKKWRDQVSRNLTAVKGALLGVAVTSVAATAALVKSSIDHADALSKQSKIIGIGIEDLSALSYAAELSDVSFEELGAGMKRNARAVQEALEGVGAGADAYKALGIEVRNADGSLKSNMQLFSEVADRFAGLEDGARKTALAQDLFGRSGANLIPLLNAGSAGLAETREEAERLGLVLNQRAGDAAEEFNDALTRIKFSVQGAGNELMVSLIPHMESFAKTINDPETQEGIKSLVGYLASIAEFSVKGAAKLGDFGAWLKDAFNLDPESFAEVADRISELQSKIVDLQKKIDEPHFWINVEGLKDQQKAASAELDKLRQLASGMFIGPLFESAHSAGGASATGGTESSGTPDNSAIDDRIAKLQQIYALHGKDTELSRLQAEIDAGILAGAAEQILLAKDWARMVDDLAYADEVRKQDEALKELTADMERQLALYGDTSAAAEMLYDIEHGRYGKMSAELKAYLVDLAAQQDLQKQMTEDEKAAADAAKQHFDTIKEFGLEAARNVQSNLAEFLFDPFEGGLKGMAKSFGETLRKMAAQAASQMILKSIFGGLGGSSNPFLSGLGGAFAGLFDSGGAIPAGKFGIVGELGPEIVHGPAMITSRMDTARLLGSGTPVIVETHGLPPSRATAPAQWDAERGALRVVMEAVKTGIREGDLDDAMASTYGLSRSRGNGGR